MGRNQTRHESSVHTIAVICDPEAAPAEIAGHLCRVLPTLLDEACGGSAGFDLRLHRERLPIDPQGNHRSLIDHAGRMKSRRGWDAAVCVTDLPLCGEDDEPLVADVSLASGVAVLSLPAFGAPRLRSRVTEVMVHILQELLPPVRDSRPTDLATPSLTGRRLPGPFRLVVPNDDGIDAQVVATRGLWRQLAGMVRVNRPWRLWRGLRRGVVAALAFGLLLLINPTVWDLGIDHTWYDLLGISLCVVAAMVVWLIFYHHLWVSKDVGNRQQLFLFNASTVITFAIGLSVAFLGLLVVTFVASHLVLSDNVLAKHFGSPPGVVEYLKLSWMATVGASVVGALGTGFETEEDVRQAAYGRRETERRKQCQSGTPGASDPFSAGHG
ncbi:hypothetical protein H7K45_04755 [Mycobacterium yunnanensis]|uniref:Uncharacterized protein n=1 Tax=Mycobacterium yunnanensis TaxID=368477 RepID=A0A9X3BZH5_9MYCO|nr:hypothetical protein [Mycobacterium yunnanensis]MCV7419843.1 hypothetical protein [Mycobacterium yunnanensis]